MRSAPARCLVLVGLLLAVPISGCTDPADQVPVPISAKEALAQAQPTAREWRSDARLVTLSGFEGAQACPANQRDTGGFETRVDHVPGDGRAAQWVLIFAPAGENTTRTLRVTENQATWLGPATGTATVPTPIANWTIDSTEALDRALEASRELELLVVSGQACLFATLGSGAQGPTWQIVARQASQPGSVTLFVDARTGEVTNRTQRDTEAGIERFEGTLQSPNETTSHAVALGENRSRLVASLQYNATRGARLNAELSHDGDRVNPSQSQTRSGLYSAEWTNLTHARYNVTVTAKTFGNRSSVDYRLTVRALDAS